jgi:hypothetical protein
MGQRGEFTTSPPVPGGVGYDGLMCRSIRRLHNFSPPATDAEIRAAALQYVRKVSGSPRPSRANAAPFDEAVEEVAAATRRLVDRLVTSAPPLSREEEARKARERWQVRSQTGSDAP